MSWDDIDKASKAKKDLGGLKERKQAEQAELAKKFNRVFTQGDGKEVFDYLFNKFVINNDTPLGSPNINYEAAYHNGEAGVLKFIASQITKAQNL